MTLLAAASRSISRERWSSFLVAPATLLRWHRELARKKWIYGKTGKPGRPPIDPEVHDLVLRIASENPRWGLRAHSRRTRQARDPHIGHRDPKLAPDRASRSSTAADRTDLDAVPTSSSARVVACDFFTVESVWLQTLYVLLFIELGSRRIHLSSSTVHPDAAWVNQQARNLTTELAMIARPPSGFSSAIEIPSSSDHSIGNKDDLAERSSARKEPG